MDPIKIFQLEVAENIRRLGDDGDLQAMSRMWLRSTGPFKYTYNFSCLDRPIIQTPQDIVATQELIWQVKPDLIIETGIAHGGSLVLSASMLALLDYADASVAGEVLDPADPKRKVVGVDIDIRAHNRAALDAHPMRNRMELIEGSSIAPEIIAKVKAHAEDKRRIMVLLDSMHTHDHVLAELEAYAPLVSLGSYCCVFDTIIEDLPDDMFPDRPWSKGNNPKTAVWEYLKSHPEFEIDKTIEHKLLITVAPDGFLRRVR